MGRLPVFSPAELRPQYEAVEPFCNASFLALALENFTNFSQLTGVWGLQHGPLAFGKWALIRTISRNRGSGLPLLLEHRLAYPLVDFLTFAGAMMRRLPPLNALKAFEAAARSESFTRAAE